MEFTREALIEVAKEHLIEQKVITEKSEVTEHSNLRDDLDLDSLDTVEMVMAIERDMNISVPDEAYEVDGDYTFGKFIDGIYQSQK